MKKKALSFDEKRERLLNIFHEKKEVFNLKELEKLGGKAGIVPQTVKDVLEALMSDNLVEGDKIGAGNFYWSLPSKAYQNLSNKVKEYEETIVKLSSTKENLEAEIAEQMLGREDNQTRKINLQKLKTLKDEYEKKLSAVEKYKRNDPDRLKQLNDEAKLAKERANRWTDNIFITKQWLSNKNPGLSEEDMNAHFQIPADLDNL